MISKLNLEEVIPQVKSFLLDLQNRITECLQQEDPQVTMMADKWQHGEGGGGLSRVFTKGAVIEKAGVNFSHVYGKSLPAAATNKRPEFADASFQALGVSVVIHPLNPYVPTTHFNVRFIAVTKGDTVHWWVGGGFDLTPYYGFEDDCIHWHKTAKQACASLDPTLYPTFKKWADDYFYLKHRNEARGIGGIFFDDVSQPGFEKCFDFLKNVGQHFILAYQPILNRRKSHAYSERERQFQLYRRGRYVEFNLLYDRGTLFGLQSNGRTESILMSLPPLVSWDYNWQPLPNTEEEKLYQYYLIPKDWAT